MKLRGPVGASLVAVSLVILRYFMLAEMSLFWVVWILMGAASLVVGSKWVLEHVTILRPYRDMWPVFCLGNMFAWLIHAGQIDQTLADSGIGSAFAHLTLLDSTLLLKLSGVPVAVDGQIVSMGSMSKVGPVAVTGLCSGFLSFVMFTAAFSLVSFDVGKTLGARRLSALFVLGVAGTFFISSLRVYLVLVLGYYWGWSILETARLYLGYVLFLCLISAFWYFTLEWSRRLHV